ncbi:MAG: (2Fe-2S)-binding protein [Halanaerobium sp.]
MSKINDRSKELKSFTKRDDDQIIICRCEEITKGEIREAVQAGMFTFQEVKKFIRTGMGLCQGQTCEKLVKNIIARELDISSLQIGSAKGRAPMRPIAMEVLANDKERS